MKLISRDDPHCYGKILGVEYYLPNGQKKRLEEHVSREVLYKVNSKYLADKLLAMAEHDIRRNMATNDQNYADQTMPNPYVTQLTAGLGNALGSWTTATATISNDWTNLAQAYPSPDVFQQYRNPPITRMRRFFRINQPIELIEGAKYGEPLDELRWKVAKWLNKN